MMFQLLARGGPSLFVAQGGNDAVHVLVRRYRLLCGYGLGHSWRPGHGRRPGCGLRLRCGWLLLPGRHRELCQRLSSHRFRQLQCLGNRVGATQRHFQALRVSEQSFEILVARYDDVASLLPPYFVVLVFTAQTEHHVEIQSVLASLRALHKFDLPAQRLPCLVQHRIELVLMRSPQHPQADVLTTHLRDVRRRRFDVLEVEEEMRKDCHLMSFSVSPSAFTNGRSVSTELWPI